MRRIVFLPIILLLAAGCASAAADLGYERVDSSDDERVSQAEFAEFIRDTNAFARYDDDDDQRLSREEYREAVDDELEGGAYFRGYDRDADGELTRDEFGNGLFATFDADGDGTLSEDEFENLAAALAFEM